MNNNYLVSVALACLLGMNPIIAETQIGSSKKSLFKTLLEDFRCMRQKGFKRCAPQQQKRMVKAGTGLAIVLLSASGLGIWFSVGRLDGVKLDPVEGDEAEEKEGPQSFDPEEEGEQKNELEEDETGAAEGPIRPTTSTEIAAASDPVVQQLAEKAKVGEESETSPEYLSELTALLNAEGSAPDVAEDVEDALAAWDKDNEADKAETAVRLAAEDSATE
ncbi:hypothetical protein E3J61_01115 [Candidatus Dependentiae bacterium]|nr:MAG: hypothetical protein E3J61_01115 [Candidatus Dependentiae bacterium]